MQNVKKAFHAPYGSVEVLRQVNFSVLQGEFVAITGPSGSGKSTCLHLAALLDYPSSGQVIFDGEDVSRLNESELCHLRKRKVGMVFQKYCLLPHRSVFENVLFRFRYLNYDRADAERRTVQALENVGLIAIANRAARLLSGGEMQRTAIARAIALEPRLLIADEPTGNLDRASANTVMECFQRLNQNGITVLFVTHNEALLGFCSRHLLCRDGFIEG
jgi:putative ABC transport system ATP-binding protein